MWRLSGELAVNCSTLVDLPRQTHGLRWMRDELMAPPDRRLNDKENKEVQKKEKITNSEKIRATARLFNAQRSALLVSVHFLLFTKNFLFRIRTCIDLHYMWIYILSLFFSLVCRHFLLSFYAAAIITKFLSDVRLGQPLLSFLIECDIFLSVL